MNVFTFYFAIERWSSVVFLLCEFHRQPKSYQLPLTSSGHLHALSGFPEFPFWIVYDFSCCWRKYASWNSWTRLPHSQRLSLRWEKEVHVWRTASFCRSSGWKVSLVALPSCFECIFCYYTHLLYWERCCNRSELMSKIVRRTTNLQYINFGVPYGWVVLSPNKLDLEALTLYSLESALEYLYYKLNKIYSFRNHYFLLPKIIFTTDQESL